MRLLLPLIIVVITLVGALSIIFADHKLFLVEHIQLKHSGSENFVIFDWAIDNASISWYADDAIEGDVRTAIASWAHSDIDELKWTGPVSTSSADVLFYFKDCDGLLAYFEVQSNAEYLRSVDDDGKNLGGNYVQKANICIDSSANFIALLMDHKPRVAAIAHEIGHVYGLADRYHHVGPDVCNADEDSIMDAAKYPTNSHCDSIDGPVKTTDIARVKSFYSEGSLRNFKTTPNTTTSSTTAMVSWEDHSWAEKEHRIKRYIYDEHGGWQMFDIEKVMEGIGTHRNVAGLKVGERPYLLSLDFDPEKFTWMYPSQKLPNGAAYRFCGAPYFLPFDKEASINTLNNCSEGVWLVIPNGELNPSASSARVNDTLTVNLTRMIPNDINEFTIKLSGPISRSDECAEADEYVKGLASFAIYGCAPGEGTMTLQTRRYGLDISEVKIVVESNLPNRVLINGQEPPEDPTDYIHLEYDTPVTVSVANLTPNDPSRFRLAVPNMFAESEEDCDSFRHSPEMWGVQQEIALPASKSLPLATCYSGRATIYLVSDAATTTHQWPSRSEVRITSAAYDLTARVNTSDYSSVTLSWKTHPDPRIKYQRVERIAPFGQSDRLAPSVTEYLDTGLWTDNEYTYQILTFLHNPREFYRSATTTVVVPTPPPGFVTPTPTHTPTAAAPTRIPPTVAPKKTDTPTPRARATYTPTPPAPPTDTYTPTPTPTETATPTITPTATYTPTMTPTPLPPPSISRLSRSGKTLTATYSNPAGASLLRFELYRSSERDGDYRRLVDSKYDSNGSPVTFRSSDGVVSGYYYRVRGQSCQAYSECGAFGGLSNPVYVSSSTKPRPDPTTPPPDPTTPPPDSPTPYPATATPVLCPEAPPWDHGQCENSLPGDS